MKIGKKKVFKFKEKTTSAPKLLTKCLMKHFNQSELFHINKFTDEETLLCLSLKASWGVYWQLFVPQCQDNKHRYFISEEQEA